MRSDERFIEEILTKEKAKRREKRAARRRAVGICSSLILVLVIGLSLPSVMSMFSAKSKGDAAPEADCAPNGSLFDQAEDKIDTEMPESPSEVPEDGRKPAFDMSTEDMGDLILNGAVEGDGYEDSDGSDKTDGDMNIGCADEDGPQSENSDWYSTPSGGSDKSDGDSDISDLNYGTVIDDGEASKKTDKAHLYIVIAAWVLAALSVVTALVLRKKRK